MADLLRRLEGLPPGEAFVLFLGENLLIALLAVGLGTLLDRRRPEPPPPLTALEPLLAAQTVFLNTLVTWAGWHLWRTGWIRVRPGGFLASLLDLGVLLLAMDAAMYGLHRLAHHPWIHRHVHGLHHRYEAPRPLTLFVMHPLEVLGFGGLWLALLLAYPPTWAGMAAYLVLNVAFGTVGHLGAEPLPWGRLGGRWLGTARFHGDHHRRPEGNFGFYTQVWDRLFKTLHE